MKQRIVIKRNADGYYYAWFQEKDADEKYHIVGGVGSFTSTSVLMEKMDEAGFELSPKGKEKTVVKNYDTNSATA